ncbi:MAG: DUF6463 family protein [Egibacteraceae bacterium]
MERHAGQLLVALGIAHILVGIALWPGVLGDIGRGGVVGAVDPYQDRQAVFWFHMSGFLMILLGQLAHWAQERTGTVPRFLGVGLLAFGLIGVALMPVSGFWAVLPIAALLMRASRAGTARRVVAADPRSRVSGP